MKLRQFSAMAIAAMGITTILVAIVAINPMMVICGILQIVAAYHIA